MEEGEFEETLSLFVRCGSDGRRKVGEVDLRSFRDMPSSLEDCFERGRRERGRRRETNGELAEISFLSTAQSSSSSRFGPVS